MATDTQSVRKEGQRGGSIDSILEQDSKITYLIVNLGTNPGTMKSVADEMRHSISEGKIKGATIENTVVLEAGGNVHALQLWKEHGYHSVAGIIGDREDDLSNSSLLNSINLIDRYRVTDLSRERVATQTRVDTELVREELGKILAQHHNVMKQIATDYGGKGELDENGFLMLPALEMYDKELMNVLERPALSTLREDWARRTDEEKVNTKRVVGGKRDQKAQPFSVSNKAAEQAVRKLNATQFPLLSMQDLTARLAGESDKRRVGPELGNAIEDILASAGTTTAPPGITWFFQHATRGSIGLVREDEHANPETKFIFLKPVSGKSEVEAIFNRRKISIGHEPLAYHQIGTSDEYVVVSRSPLLAITAEVAPVVRGLETAFFDAYTDALMKTGFGLLAKYHSVEKGKTNEIDRALVLHKYKATELIGVEDLEQVTTVELSPQEKRLFRESLTLYDDQSNWSSLLFGPIMDFKTYNHGNRMGVIKPTKEQVLKYLFNNAKNPDPATAESAMKETFGILEYAGRLGIILEDYFHTVNSPDLNIDPAKRPGYYNLFVQNVMPDATSADLAGMWPAYFASESDKTFRKMQRTVHYMITNILWEGNPKERNDYQKHYLQEYEYYAKWLAQTAYAGTVLTQDYRETPFGEQLRVLSQLYAESNPKLPSHPENLTFIPRAICGKYIAMQRLVESPPIPRLLKTLDVSR